MAAALATTFRWSLAVVLGENEGQCNDAGEQITVSIGCFCYFFSAD
jgi:hypothetical protein